MRKIRDRELHKELSGCLLEKRTFLLADGELTVPVIHFGFLAIGERIIGGVVHAIGFAVEFC
jgi:hypothetical protein